jgi:hypothetical protein
MINNLNYNSLASMFIVSVILIVKAFDNKQWHLDWFITHANIIGFKVNVIALEIAHNWALGTLCCKATNWCLP